MDLKLTKFQLIFVFFVLKCAQKSSGQENNYLLTEKDDRIENSTAPKCTFPIANSNITVDKVFNKLKIRCNDSFNGEILELLDGCESPYVKKVEIIGCNLSNTTTIRKLADKLSIENIEYLSFECKSNNSLLKHQLSGLNSLIELHYTGPLSSDTFADLGNVTILNLNTDIRSIDAKSFFNLRKLINLWIRPVPKISTDYNDANITLPELLFQNQARLTVLDLTKNNITSLSELIFFNLVSLIHLDLSSNKLQTIPTNLFESMVDLKILDLNDNQLKCLHDDTFRWNAKLEQLHLERNQLDFNENSTIFEKTPNLMNIFLQNNSITTFPRNFNGKLSTLNLSYNKIKELNLNIASTPSGNSDDFELIVTRNSLTKLPTVNISTKGELSIHAANNSITKLLIDHLPKNLTILDVSYNSIKTFDLMVLERAKIMTKFEMIGNPLRSQKCDCKLINVVETHLSENDFDSIRCKNGTSLLELRKLCSVSKNTMNEDDESHWIIIMVIAVILIAFASIFCFIYREQIKNRTIDNQWRVYFLNKKDSFERRCRGHDTSIQFKNMDQTHNIRDYTTLMNTSEASSYH